MAKVKGGGGSSNPNVYTTRTIVWFDDGTTSGNMVGWQQVVLYGPSPVDDITQGTQTIVSIGPLYLQSAPPVNPPNFPALSALQVIASPGVPWWFLAGQSFSPVPVAPSPTGGSSPPYYY